VWRKLLIFCLALAATTPWRDIAVAPAHATPGLQRDADIYLAGVLPKNSAEQFELTFWESIKNSNHASDYEAYLQAYPKGRFAALARARIERLRAAAPKSEAVPETRKPADAKGEAAPDARKPADAKGAAPSGQARAAARPARHRPRAAPPAATDESADETTETTPVTELRDCAACPVLLALPAATFTMGSNSGDPSERPAHQVTLDTPFAIGKYEVTAEQWNACVDAGACQRAGAAPATPGTYPAREISWDDSQQYLKWLSYVSGKAYRLPTEAEWEYAARGGTASRYWWGDQMRPRNANCEQCGAPWSPDGPASVGTFPANPFGLYDMNGSVWEWVNDCWHDSYEGAPADGSVWDEPNCEARVIRGGSWREGAGYMASTTRSKDDPGLRHPQNGLRVARSFR
jgi:formylglycine-generating enzyme required for sulfatase activity